MINFLIFNFISMIIINQIKINSLKKILYFIIINFIIIFFISNNAYEVFEKIILLISMLFLFINCYTVRYSSIRIEILKNLSIKQKIITEKELYQSRKERLENSNTTFMKKNLFIFINVIVIFLRKILL